MWNFVGKQNGQQGYYPWDITKGNWQSGIDLIDESKLHNMDKLPDTMEQDKSNNKYYFLPLIFGLIGLLFHFSKSRNEFWSLLFFFIMTGIGIIIYSNQPPNEPRERDYVLVGSFMAFSMWIGLAVPAIFNFIRSKASMKGIAPAAIAGLLVLIAPFLMGFENFDDHSRKDHTAARDYASNFLNSVEKDAIIFTYGDNDTYPLWYAQEVEGIRTDVRVVNLSLIAVDWYINKLRNKMNDSPPIKLSISEDAYRGKKRNQVFFFNPNNREDKVMNNYMPLNKALEFVASDRSSIESQYFLPTKTMFIPINRDALVKKGMFPTLDTADYAKIIPVAFSPQKNYITKDDLAILDVISSNINDRPIYFATTCINEKLMGLNDYMQLEGLALRIVPKKTPSQRGFGIYGSGDVSVDIAYDNIMNKWKWGNFDKVDTYVDGNYLAAVQSMRLGMLRVSSELLKRKDTKRAGDVAKKFFEAFPHMNFPYDAGIVTFIGILVQTEDYEDAKKHIRILAEESKQYMEFYESLDNDDFKAFADDMEYRLSGLREAMMLSKQVKDPEFEQEIEGMIGQYAKQQNRNKN